MKATSDNGQCLTNIGTQYRKALSLYRGTASRLQSCIKKWIISSSSGKLTLITETNWDGNRPSPRLQTGFQLSTHLLVVLKVPCRTAISVFTSYSENGCSLNFNCFTQSNILCKCEGVKKRSYITKKKSCLQSCDVVFQRTFYNTDWCFIRTSK
jgi:hypothetical protein